MTDQTPQREPGQVAAATGASVTTAFVVWIVGRVIFHDEEIPGEVYGFLQVLVPSCLGFLGAEVAYRRARRRAEH